MIKYIKTTISREKLYNKNYTRDSIENINVEEEVIEDLDRYKTLIDILTIKYREEN